MLIYVMDYDKEYVIARCDNSVDATRIAKEYEEEYGLPAVILSEDAFYGD